VEKGDGESDSPVDLLCHLRVLQPEGAEEEVLLTLVDVTSFRNLDRAKTDFVANASHELKTPLSSILGYAETLLEGAQDNPAARGPFLQKILANAQRLQGLVQDLLNLSQLESQGPPPRLEPLFVRDFVQSAWNQHRAAAEIRGIRLENRVPPDLAWKMEPRDLDLILGNLVGNAVKYNAPAGKVRVEWDPALRALGVRDTGEGIPAEALPRIFERFYRGGGARARNEGTGLGLAIVKHAAQRYGISVSAESTLGEGSRFVLVIPEDVGG
jgi:two-component system phosphate regulon sensor histidine kinase PhoR